MAEHVDSGEPAPAPPCYRSLDPARIVETCEALRRRISERFPGSGLSRVAGEVLAVSGEAAALSAWLQKPILWVRASILGGQALIVVILIGVAYAVDWNLSLFSSLSDLLQGLESAINEFVFAGVGIYFFATAEARLKRRRALKALHELRSLSHIIDMHQLTKDPEQLHRNGAETASSPRRVLTPFQLTRYLDYCSELLAVISKVGALYVQDFDDPVTLSAVNELEDLTTGLQRKIWQKIMIQERVTGGG